MKIDFFVGPMTRLRRFPFHFVWLRYHKPLFIGGVIFLVFLILLITTLLFLLSTQKLPLEAEQAGAFLKESWGKLVSQELSVQIEKDLLPADGKATTILTASLSGERVSETAIGLELLEGKIGIKPLKGGALFQSFTLQAGKEPGLVKLKVKALFLEKTVSLTLFDPTPPSAPLIKSPSNGSVLASPRPEIRGSAPKKSQLILFTDAFENGRGEADQEGEFTLLPQTPLKNGPHLIRVVAENQYGLKSLPSETLKLTIDAKALKLDLINLKLTPNPVKAGEIVSLFVPASVEVSQIWLLLSEQRYELKDRYGSSVFSGRIIAPKIPGNYPLSFLAQNPSGNSTSFTNAATLVVR